MKTAKRKSKTNKRKSSRRGGGWPWGDNSGTTAPQQGTWGSWFSGIFGPKKPTDVSAPTPAPSPATTPEQTSASSSEQTSAPAPVTQSQSVGGKKKSNKGSRKNKK